MFAAMIAIGISGRIWRIAAASFSPSISGTSKSISAISIGSTGRYFSEPYWPQQLRHSASPAGGGAQNAPMDGQFAPPCCHLQLGCDTTSPPHHNAARPLSIGEVPLPNCRVSLADVETPLVHTQCPVQKPTEAPSAFALRYCTLLSSPSPRARFRTDSKCCLCILRECRSTHSAWKTDGPSTGGGRRPCQ